MILKIVRVAIGLVLSAVVIVPAAFLSVVVFWNISVDDPSLTPSQQGFAWLIIFAVAAGLLYGIWVLVLRELFAKQRIHEIEPPGNKNHDPEVWPPAPNSH